MGVAAKLRSRGRPRPSGPRELPRPEPKANLPVPWLSFGTNTPLV
jgi:hypothetical protein